jgi:hypothetical protein
MPKITPQPSNHFFKQISIGPAPNIVIADKDTYTSFTTLNELKRIDKKMTMSRMSIVSDTDDTKSSFTDDDMKESDLCEDVGYDNDAGEDDIESIVNDDNDFKCGKYDDDSKSTISDTLSEIKSVKSIKNVTRMAKGALKKEESMQLTQEEIDDNW